MTGRKMMRSCKKQYMCYNIENKKKWCTLPKPSGSEKSGQSIFGLTISFFLGVVMWQLRDNIIVLIRMPAFFLLIFQKKTHQLDAFLNHHFSISFKTSSISVVQMSSFLR